MRLFHAALLLVLVIFRLGTGKLGRCHGEAVAKQIGDGEDENHAVDNSAPTTPVSTAKVVTVPSIPQ